MNSLKLLLLALGLTTVAASVVSCAASSGFQQPAPRTPISEPPQVNDSAVESAFELRAQLPKPYRLGVVFRDPPGRIQDSPWRWEPEQRAQLTKTLEKLERGGEVDTVFTITRSTIEGDGLRAIRIAAAKHGADAVLVISGQDEAEQDLNGWAATYVALLPMLFVPAAELEVRFTAHAELWDVRNEFLYMAAEGDARVDQQRPLMAIDREEGTAKAQREALALLGSELQRRLARLHGTTVAAR
jgi:hypothetical protein